MNAPCLDCGNRTPECHSSCEEYKEFRELKDRLYRERTDIEINRYWAERKLKTDKLRVRYNKRHS